MKQNTKQKRRYFYERGEWTAEDLQMLREKYPTTPVEELAEQMGRSCGSLRQKAYLLGIYRGASRHLAEQRAADGSTEKLPRYGHATFKKWTLEDITLLREQVHKVPIEALAKRMGRTYESVRNKAYRMGFIQQESWVYHPWTPADEAKLLEWLPTLPLREIARRLGRTVASVRFKGIRLGMTATSARDGAEAVLPVPSSALAPVPDRVPVPDEAPAPEQKPVWAEVRAEVKVKPSPSPTRRREAARPHPEVGRKRTGDPAAPEPARRRGKPWQLNEAVPTPAAIIRLVSQDWACAEVKSKYEQAI